MVLPGRLQRKTRNLQGFTESSVKLWFVAVFSRKRVEAALAVKRGNLKWRKVTYRRHVTTLNRKTVRGYSTVR